MGTLYSMKDTQRDVRNQRKQFEEARASQERYRARLEELSAVVLTAERLTQEAKDRVRKARELQKKAGTPH